MKLQITSPKLQIPASAGSRYIHKTRAGKSTKNSKRRVLIIDIDIF